MAAVAEKVTVRKIGRRSLLMFMYNSATQLGVISESPIKAGDWLALRVHYDGEFATVAKV